MKPKILLVICSMFFPVLSWAQQPADEAILSMEKNERDGTPKSIMFSSSANFHPAQAQSVFERYLDLKGRDNKMVLGNVTTTRHSISTYRYFQWYKGIKIPDGVYTLTVKNDIISWMAGNFYRIDADLPANPVLNEEQAFRKALDFVGADKYKWQVSAEELFIKAEYNNPDTSWLPHGQLAWIEDYMTGTGKTDGQLHLAYSFDIYAQTPLSRQIVYIDAATGKTLFSNTQLKHSSATSSTLYSGTVPIQTARVGSSYRLYDSTRGNGVYTRNMNNGTSYGSATDFTSPTNTWPTSAANTDAIDCHWAAEMVYDYWKIEQGRLSWDNLNGQLKQYVHYDIDYDNAFWDGSRMTYGDGSGLAAGGFTSLVSLDVTAHEIGHGVCEATANLNYSGESGGLNEGFSDCWGATIENWANPHEADAVAKQPWKIGEEIGGGSPLRSMDNPNLQGQPDTYHGTYWYTTTGCTPSGSNDNCGVHTNSGVLNKWYNLICMGGSGVNDIGNSFSVTAIGWTKAADILYQAELALTPTSQYADCRTATINAARTLFGLCSAEEQAVTNAWYAVGVGFYFIPCVPQIGFTQFITNVDEYSSSVTCPSSHIVNIGLKAVGPPITGGTPTITVSAGTGGTGIAGIDYSLPSSTTFSFPPGDTTTHFLPVTIFDNGNVGTGKDFTLTFTLNAMSTTTIISPINGSNHIYIVSDDKAPEAGGTEYHRVNTMNVTSNLTSAFYGSRTKAHSQFLISPAELTAAGVRPNVPISQIAFNVVEKNTTQPYTNYTINIGNTSITNLSSSFITTGLTTVYTGNFTTYMGWDTLDFTTPFMWDGLNYMVVEVCFTNTSAGPANDKVDGYSGSGTITAYNSSNSGSGTGCALAYNASKTNSAKPIMRFKQVIAPTRVETVAGTTRSWYVQSGEDVYFYDPVDTAVLMRLKSPTASLGCVNTTLAVAGTGFAPFVHAAGVNRSVKEFTMTPTTNAMAAKYDITLYFTNAELGSANPANLYIIKTDAATDAGIFGGNSEIATPVITYGSNYTGFKGHFTGFSRYFLVDKFVSGLAVDNMSVGTNNIWIYSNPFHDNINIGYSFTASTTACIKLHDITGRTIFNKEIQLASGQNKFSVDCSGYFLAPGAYIMQIITGEGVFNQKLIKD